LDFDGKSFALTHRTIGGDPDLLSRTGTHTPMVWPFRGPSLLSITSE